MRARTPLLFALLLACIDTNLAAAAPSPPNAGIASAHPAATQAGMEILRAGGNAFDAAIAVSAALAVVEPTGSGLSGGGFFLLHRASDESNEVIDARESAPAAASRDMFLDHDGNPVPGLSLQSALGAGIPGEPAALALLAAKFGHLPLQRSLQPAIILARSGFELYPRLREALTYQQAKFAASPVLARIFLRHGEVPPLGTRIRQPALAKTLEYLATHGMDAFYHGKLASELVRDERAQGGCWSEADLSAYHVIEREPLVGTYQGARVISVPPPSSGGVALIEALNILGNFDLSGDHLQRDHLIIEASRRVLRDRAIYLGNPAFTPVPVSRLIDPNYAAGLAASIRLDRATPSSMLPGIDSANPGPHTTHFSILDREGNRVAATITLNDAFGSARLLPASGVFLNDEMDDFSSKPGSPNGYGLVGSGANAIAPGKRPLSSMTPSFIETPDRVMIVGTPGGSRITGMVLLATLDFLAGDNAQQIVSAPRIHHQYLPDVVEYEPGALNDAEIKALQDRGDTLQGGRQWGNMQVVIWDKRAGHVDAASDPRGDGAGAIE